MEIIALYQETDKKIKEVNNNEGFSKSERMYKLCIMRGPMSVGVQIQQQQQIRSNKKRSGRQPQRGCENGGI